MFSIFKVNKGIIRTYNAILPKSVENTADNSVVMCVYEN